MKFRELSEIFEKIESTSLRNEKTEMLAKVLGSVSDDELGAVIYLSLGRLRPLHDSLELNLAEKMAVKVVAWAVNDMESKIWDRYKEVGDLGEVVYELKKDDDGVGLSVEDVYSELVKIAEDSGVGSQDRKVRRLGMLLRKLSGLSAKYVIRLVVGRLRLGFSDMTVLDALSWMRNGDKSDRKKLERAFNVSVDLVKIGRVYKEFGVSGLDGIDVTPGVPIRPAKAERLGEMKDILEKLSVSVDGVSGVAVEPKLDGMRVQVHIWKPDGSRKKLGSNGSFGGGLFGESDVVVKVFSRGMEDVTHQFPDVVDAGIRFREFVKKDMILDGEAIGYDAIDGSLLPFQKTIKRKRKHNVGTTAKDIPLMVFVFDVLYVDGGVLDAVYLERRKMLEDVFGGWSGDVFRLTEMSVVSNVGEERELFKRFVGEGLEGMMCKRLDSVYQAGARNFNWVKYKKAHEKQLADSLDCVVMGYYKGKGKRNEFGIGAFLVGVLSEDGIVTVAKIGTGLSDEQWVEMKRRLDKITVSDMPSEYVVDKGLYPDVWVVPSVVVEIEADEITKSPIHTAGYALRFPRLIRFRDDKKYSDATSLSEISGF